MKDASIIVGRAALAAALKTTERQVLRWVRMGMPCRTRKPKSGGRPEYVFRLQQVRAWIEAKAQRFDEQSDRKPDKPSIVKRSSKRADDIDGMIRRLRRRERALYDAMMETKDAKQQASFERRWNYVVETRRKAEKDRAAILVDSTRYILVEEAEKAQTTMALEIKAALLDMPRSLAPRLAGKQRAADIEVVLREELTLVLRKLSEERQTA